MSPRGDDGREMPHGPFDDDAFDAALRGSPHPDGEPASFASFVDDVRAAAEAVPIVPSAALAAALTHGVSPSANEHQPVWRKCKMKIQGFVAGLSVAGKLALGVGVAAAATTGAGAAGVLPGPVQHAFSNVVHSVTPFDSSGGSNQADGEHGSGAPGTTTTTMVRVGDTTTTLAGSDPAPPPVDGGGSTSPTTIKHHEGDGPTPTTVETTPPTEQHNGDGNGETTTTLPTTTTTEHHDGDNNNPESLTLNCERGREPNHVTCTWSASTSPDHARYVLLRVSNDSQNGRVIDSTDDGLTFTDTTVTTGVHYGYRVVSLRADSSTESHSPMVYLTCCGDA